MKKLITILTLVTFLPTSSVLANPSLRGSAVGATEAISTLAPQAMGAKSKINGPTVELSIYGRTHTLPTEEEHALKEIAMLTHRPYMIGDDGPVKTDTREAIKRENEKFWRSLEDLSLSASRLQMILNSPIGEGPKLQHYIAAKYALIINNIKIAGFLSNARLGGYGILRLADTTPEEREQDIDRLAAELHFYNTVLFGKGVPLVFQGIFSPEVKIRTMKDALGYFTEYEDDKVFDFIDYANCLIPMLCFENVYQRCVENIAEKKFAERDIAKQAFRRLYNTYQEEYGRILNEMHNLKADDYDGILAVVWKLNQLLLDFQQALEKGNYLRALIDFDETVYNPSAVFITGRLVVDFDGQYCGSGNPQNTREWVEFLFRYGHYTTAMRLFPRDDEQRAGQLELLRKMDTALGLFEQLTTEERVDADIHHFKIPDDPSLITPAIERMRRVLSQRPDVSEPQPDLVATDALAPKAAGERMRYLNNF